MPFFRRIMGSLRRFTGLWNIDRRVQKEIQRQQDQRVQIGIDRMLEIKCVSVIPLKCCTFTL